MSKPVAVFWRPVKECEPPTDVPLHLWVHYGKLARDFSGFATVGQLVKGCGWDFDDPDLTQENVTVTHWKTVTSPQEDAVIEQSLFGCTLFDNYPMARPRVWRDHDMSRGTWTQVFSFPRETKPDPNTPSKESVEAAPDPSGVYDPTNPRCQTCEVARLCRALNGGHATALYVLDAMSGDGHIS